MVIGEPVFSWEGERTQMMIPEGSEHLALAVLAEARTPEYIARALQEEYWAIVVALYRLGYPFRFLCNHSDRVDRHMIAVMAGALHLRGLQFQQEYAQSITSFPRDFGCMLPGGTYCVNVQMMQAITHHVGPTPLVASLLGEGGRVLPRRDVLLVPEMHVVADGALAPLDEATLRCVRGRVGKLPLAGLRFLDRQEDGRFTIGRCRVNDHLDRVGALIEGRHEDLHLIVDPSYYRRSLTGIGQLLPLPNRMYLERTCRELGLTLHVPERISVPYSLNMEQFADGRVLMTSGDAAVETIVRSIVGEANVITTQIPIRYFSIFLYAGIRCLIGYLPPMPLMTGGAAS